MLFVEKWILIFHWFNFLFLYFYQPFRSQQFIFIHALKILPHPHPTKPVLDSERPVSLRPEGLILEGPALLPISR